MSIKTRARWYALEKLLKGVANHRRIEMLFLLERYPGLSTDEIVSLLGINYRTGSVHVNRLVAAGVVHAYRRAQSVAHDLTKTGTLILALLRKLQ